MAILNDEEAERLGFAPSMQAPGKILSDDEADAIGTEDPNASRWGQSMLNGLTFGLRPRIQAAIETGAVSGPEYEKARNTQWAKDDVYANAKPWTNMALEVAGSLPTMLIPWVGGARVAQAANRGAQVADNLSRGQRLMRAAGIGKNIGTTGSEAGAMGAKAAALYGGLGSRDETATGRLADAVTSIPFGYVGGRVGDAVGSRLVRAGEEIFDAARVGGNAQLGARTGLRRALERDHVTTDQLRTAALPNMGRTNAPPEAVEQMLVTYGRAIDDGATQAAARTAAQQNYVQTMRDRGSTATARTLTGHVNSALRRYEAANEVPLAIDEMARLAGGRGQNLQWTRRAAANSPGEGREALFDSVTSRQEDLIPNVRRRISETLGDENFLTAKGDVKARNRVAEDALYGIARSNEQPFDLGKVFDEAGGVLAFRGGKARTAMEEAAQIMRGDPLPDGTYQRHTLDSYIQARGQLSDLIDDSYRVNPATGAKESTTATRALVDLKTKMDGIVGDANPKWKWANSITRGGRSAESAMDDARRMKLTDNDKHTAQILERVSTMRGEINRLSAVPVKARSMEDLARLNLLETQMEGYQTGFARVLHDALNGLGDTHDVSKLFLKGGRNAQSGVRRVMDVMLGDEAPVFMDMVRRGQIAGTTYKNQFNSQTMPLREASDEAKQESKISGMLRALAYAANPKQMLADAGESISNRLFAERNAQIAQRLALTTEHPNRFFGMLNELDQLGLGRGRAFTAEGANLYSAPSTVTGAFAAQTNSNALDDENDQWKRR